MDGAVGLMNLTAMAARKGIQGSARRAKRFAGGCGGGRLAQRSPLVLERAREMARSRAFSVLAQDARIIPSALSDQFLLATVTGTSCLLTTMTT